MRPNDYAKTDQDPRPALHPLGERGGERYVVEISAR